MKKLAAGVAAIMLGGMILGAAPAWAQSAGFSPGASGGPTRGIMVPAAPAPQTNVPEGFLGNIGAFREPDWRGEPRPRPRDRKRWRGHYGQGFALGFYGLSRGGYFAERQGAPAVVNGHVDYDYDRGYPYDYYSYASPEREDDRFYSEPREPYCETVWTRGPRGTGRAPVRVCRN
jgi:hypothetical protein